MAGEEEKVTLTDAQGRILKVLGRKGGRKLGMYLQQVADYAGRDKGNVRHILNKLCEKGLAEIVHRKNIPNRFYRLTEKGVSHLNNGGGG